LAPPGPAARSTRPARVRTIAGGNETVPTVEVGDRVMVNPKASEILDAVRATAPGLLDKLNPDALTTIARGTWHAGLVLAALVAAIWFALASGNPTTTYHFAPAVVAAAWPVGRRLRVTGALPAGTALVIALGGALLALATTVLLATRNALAGPALFGLPSAFAETLAGVAVGALAGAALALAGRRRR
jgi:hypothetical protein